MVNVKHDQAVDELEKRVYRLHHDLVKTYVDYFNKYHRKIGEIDVLVTDYRNGKYYHTYYEVKTGRDPKKARYKAQQQANRFFSQYAFYPEDKLTFVYIHVGHGVERWKECNLRGE